MLRTQKLDAVQEKNTDQEWKMIIYSSNEGLNSVYKLKQDTMKKIYASKLTQKNPILTAFSTALHETQNLSRYTLASLTEVFIMFPMCFPPWCYLLLDLVVRETQVKCIDWQSKEWSVGHWDHLFGSVLTLNCTNSQSIQAVYLIRFPQIKCK